MAAGLIGYVLCGKTYAKFQQSFAEPKSQWGKRGEFERGHFDRARSCSVDQMIDEVEKYRLKDWNDYELLKNKLFCEWGYFINLDTEEFEVYHRGKLVDSIKLDQAKSLDYRTFVRRLESKKVKMPKEDLERMALYGVFSK